MTRELNIKEPFLPNMLKGVFIIMSAAFLMLEPCIAIPTSYKIKRGRINRKLLARLFERWKYDFI